MLCVLGDQAVLHAADVSMWGVLCMLLRVLQGPGPGDELLARHEHANIDIRREHMLCLQETEWLNDEVINMYVAMMQVRMFTLLFS
jgi:hypothetical protein